jgi:Carboxypeptidase regulatory-like domain
MFCPAGEHRKRHIKATSSAVTMRRNEILPRYCSRMVASSIPFNLASCCLPRGTGAISGATAVLVGAQVKITDVATGYMRTAQSNDHGLYVVSLLPPGHYTLEVKKQGFKVASSDVQVIVAETTVLNICMETGAVNETITVAFKRGIADRIQ